MEFYCILLAVKSFLLVSSNFIWSSLCSTILSSLVRIYGCCFKLCIKVKIIYSASFFFFQIIFFFFMEHIALSSLFFFLLSSLPSVQTAVTLLNVKAPYAGHPYAAHV